MAIWQYDFLILPKNSISGKPERGNFLSDEDDLLDDEFYWLQNPIGSDSFDEIEAFLPRNISWSKNILLFGEQDSNRFEVYKNENDQVISVSFRMDFTTDYENLLRLITEFVSLNGFIILDDQGNILPNNLISLKACIESSPQFSTFKKLSQT